MFLATEPNGDFHVLTQGCQKFHQAPDRKVTGPVPHQQRDLRLLYAENLGDLDLCHAAVLEDCIDLQSELSLEQFLFGVGKAKVRKDVFATFGDVSYARACFFALNFISVPPFRHQ